MGANYFTPENAWRHLFFIHGCTADEFYTDGGLKLNIEQLTQLELKRSGYERVVFYDKDQKLYCYDDESFALLRGRSGAGKGMAPAPEGAAPTHRKGGLKRGKLGKKAAASAEPVQPFPTSRSRPMERGRPAPPPASASAGWAMARSTWAWWTTPSSSAR